MDYKYSSEIPQLTEAEYIALKADIAKRGVIVPPVVDEYWNVIDGGHRLKIVDELKKELSVQEVIRLGLNDIHFDIRVGLTEEEKKELAWDLNAHRRHWSKEQRQEIALKLRQNGDSYRAIGEKLGVDHKTARSDVLSTGENSPVQLPEMVNGKDGKQRPAHKRQNKPMVLSQKVKNDIERIREKAQERPEYQYLLDELEQTGNYKRAVKELRRIEKRETLEKLNVEISSSDTVWHGKFQELGWNIPDNSVDLIFTDPPYGNKAITLYEDLGIFAARVLKPSGLCLAYTGQGTLPQVLEMMSKSLKYMWTFAIKHNGGFTEMKAYNIRNLWKPIIVYYKPPLGNWWEWVNDIVTDGHKEKDDHEWQQALSEAEHYIKYLCPQGGLVVDPFTGSGTTLVAAKKLGFRYIGIEEDLVDVKRALKRLEDE